MATIKPKAVNIYQGMPGLTFDTALPKATTKTTTKVAPKTTVSVKTTTPVKTGAVVSAPVKQTVKAPDDASNMYNTATGELNKNYSGYVAPAGSVGAIAKSTGYSYNPSPEDLASSKQYDKIGDYYQQQFDQETDPNKIYQQTLAQYQAQIDSINNIFNDQLNNSRIVNAPTYKAREDQNRIGQVMGGLVQSPMGQAQTNEIQTANAQEQASAEAIINDKKAVALANVFGQVRQSAEAELTAKREAKAKGADSLLQHLNAAPARKAKQISTVAKSLIAQGIDINSLAPDELNELLKTLGTDKDTFIAGYDAAMVEEETRQQEQVKADLENKKTEAEIDNLVNKYEFEAAQKALDRALEEKRISVSWYNATTSRMSENRQAASAKSDETKTYDSKNIPSSIKGEVISDIQNVKKLKLADLIAAYPEVDSKYLTDLYNDNQ